MQQVPQPSAWENIKKRHYGRRQWERLKKKCRLIPWDNMKHDLPPQLKIFPVVAIPHKISLFQAILYLYLALIVNGIELPSVKKAI